MKDMPFVNYHICEISSDYSGKIFIGNSFVESIGKRVYVRHSPYDNKKTGVFADSTPDDVEEAIKVAHEAFKQWSKNSYEFRADLLQKLSDLLSKYRAGISETITKEMGKPIFESIFEVECCIKLLSCCCSETKRMHGQFFSEPDKKMLVTYKPHGVVALIASWNFPLITTFTALGALLGAGCTCVYKPSPETPLTGLLIARLIKEAGFPTGVFNVITANYESTAAIGSALSTHPLVRHIAFTGSTPVGKIIMEKSASTVKRLSLELGGNAPAIVFNKANIEQTVKNLIKAKFFNAGQACISPNRIFVQKEIYDDFVKALTFGVSKIKCGHPMDASTQISCLYDKKGFDKVTAIVDAAIKEGAHYAYQGYKVEECGPLFYPPTILTECKLNMSIFKCEIFGPVCAIYKFDTESEVFEQMNNCAQGLAAYVYSTDMSQIFRTVEEFQFGMVVVNGYCPFGSYLPVGGHKESGLGSLMGTGSIRNFCDAQSIVLNQN